MDIANKTAFSSTGCLSVKKSKEERDHERELLIFFCLWSVAATAPGLGRATFSMYGAKTITIRPMIKVNPEIKANSPENISILKGRCETKKCEVFARILLK